MFIDKNGIIPLYYQIKEYILEGIHSGKYAVDEKIPGELELAQVFNVSRPTVRQAINELVFERVLRRERGKGTFVNKPIIHSNLDILTPYVEELQSQGLSPGLKEISRKIIPATDNVAKVLNISKNEEVIEFIRVRLANNEPVILRTSLFSYKLLPQLMFEQIEPLYPVIEKYGFRLVKAVQNLQVVKARENEAKILQIPKGFPLILWEGTVYDREGRPVEFVKSLYRSDRYNFHVVQHRDQQVTKTN